MKKHASLLVLIGAWLVLFAAFTFLIPSFRFADPRNLETIAKQTVIVGFAAIGMTFVIIRGAIDLSVGSVIAFVTVVIAYMLQIAHVDGVTAMVVGILAGGICGLLNGLIVTQFKVSPFIATLGTMSIVRGMAKWLGKEQKIDVDHMPPWQENILARLPADKRWMVFPPGVWLLVFFAVAAAWFLKGSVFGRNVIASGSNEDAAYLAGLNVRRDLIMVFLLGGLFTGIAGLMMFSRLTVGDPTVAVGLELDVIAAVVIGGASLSGGQGSIAGSLIGALIMNTIKSGANQLGLPNFVQEVATGIIIITAVTIDRLRAAKA